MNVDAIKIIGWGVENDEEFFVVDGTFGETWGIKGLMKLSPESLLKELYFSIFPENAAMTNKSALEFERYFKYLEKHEPDN